MPPARRIVLAVDSYPPVPKAGGIQMRDLALALASLGHDVTVLAADPSVHQTVITCENAVCLVRVRTADTKTVGRAQRALNELRLPSAMWSAYKSLPEAATRVDLFAWYSPTIFLGPLAHRMRKEGAHCYLILRDIFPDWAREMGELSAGPAFWTLKAFEWFQYRAAHVIGVQSPNNLAYFETYPSKHRVEVLHNWRNLRKPASIQKTLADYELAGKTVLVFGGTLGVAQDLDNLLRLAANLQDLRSIVLLIVGEGSEKTRLEKAARERALENVKFAPALPEAEFEALLRECAAGLISLDARLRSHNIPGKLLSYLKMGLPVIASVNPGNDLIEMLQQSGAGTAVLNGDDNALTAAVRTVCLNAEQRRHMGAKAEELGRAQFSSERAATQILATCDSTRLDRKAGR